MDVLYAASFNFIPTDNLGKKIEGVPTQVRAFTVTGATRQSWILEGGLKVRKKHMVLELKEFSTGLFQSLDAACRSIQVSGNNPGAERVRG
ncbi:hypothetical protein KDX16_16655 [Burkholderia vietnamiensis]|jgi:hypothetical protein|uniref:Uncharacterized protein n=1 Tax=Burkholderia contaminans TaxID=488447 RepID=A0AAP4VJP2_9BURK|nr:MULTISPECIES: hypothetical protein [Burkholderia]HDR9756576.1 hypothetical protein [Burkholderia cepacia ATCC 25416]MBR7917418.1 hypothetical protein [Burkholderia vietnamiensis]MBR8054274.1 hypothetical protein [Burkholderia vietnamiensis]MDN7458448.1 hypothetical protein [Burkholderia cenocepacia]MDN7569923.1 hypothetical protein [Burkholderia contaminans]